MINDEALDNLSTEELQNRVNAKLDKAIEEEKAYNETLRAYNDAVRTTNTGSDIATEETEYIYQGVINDKVFFGTKTVTGCLYYIRMIELSIISALESGGIFILRRVEAEDWDAKTAYCHRKNKNENS